MPTSKTIVISTDSGLSGTVWMGDSDGWVVATDSDLYDITLTGDNLYWLEFVEEGGYPSSLGGNIGYGKYKIQIDSYVIYVDFRDSDFLDPSLDPDPYYQYNMLLRWNTNSRLEQEHIDHTWHEVSPDSTVGIWEGGRKQSGDPPTTQRFVPTVPANLTLTAPGNRPKLAWDASAPLGGNVTYEVWRKKGGLTWSEIA